MSSKHMVVCYKCGKQFDANTRGSRYNEKKRRYMCKDCYKSIQAANKVAEQQRIKSVDLALASGEISENKATILKHKNSKGKMIAGIIVAACGFVSLFATDKTVSYIVISILMILIGAGLLAWYFLGEKKYKDAITAEKNDVKQPDQETFTKVCSKCGASTRGQVCEYCGSLLEE